MPTGIAAHAVAVELFRELRRGWAHVLFKDLFQSSHEERFIDWMWSVARKIQMQTGRRRGRYEPLAFSHAKPLFLQTKNIFAL